MKTCKTCDWLRQDKYSKKYYCQISGEYAGWSEYFQEEIYTYPDLDPNQKACEEYDD